MASTADVFGITILAALNLFTKHVSNFVSLPWLDIGLKNQVDLFEGPSHRLRVREKHVYSHHKAEHTKNYVGFPLNIMESGCHKIGQSEVEDPVGGGGNANTFGPVLQWENLRCVYPCGRGLKMSVWSCSLLRS